METNEYNIWDILGIETTKDEKKITEAYREKLSVTNPEDKPEEFKQLRSAYEEALAYARKPEGAQGEDRQIDEWLKQLFPRSSGNRRKQSKKPLNKGFFSFRAPNMLPL